MISSRIKYIFFAAAFLLGVIIFVPQHTALATTTNISSGSTAHWAWNDEIGWIDFYTPNTATVSSAALTGYASSSDGYISLDCATSPASPTSNICPASNYQVTNDGSGNLSGWAWNDEIGWISFWCGSTAPGCGGVSYRVTISPTTGDFSGWAWNDAVGWISFNCTNVPSSCSTSSYKVNTSWVATSTTGQLDSSTFDTGVNGGAEINSIMWDGSMPSPANGAYVAFQIATSNTSTGPWSFVGPDGTASTVYGGSGASPGVPITLNNYTLQNDQRYFRYRIILSSTQTQSFSPRVDDVSVNWSR